MGRCEILMLVVNFYVLFATIDCVKYDFKMVFHVCDQNFAGSNAKIQVVMYDQPKIRTRGNTCTSPLMNNNRVIDFERNKKYTVDWRCDSKENNLIYPKCKKNCGNLKTITMMQDGSGIGDDLCIHNISIYDMDRGGLNNGLIFYRTSDLDIDLQSDGEFYQIKPEWTYKGGPMMMAGPVMGPGGSKNIEYPIQEQVRNKWGLGCFKPGKGTGIFQKC